MPLLLELSGEHPTLPAAEALAALAMQGPVAESFRDDTLLAVEAPGADVEDLAARLGLTHRIGDLVASVEPTEGAIVEAAKDLDARLGVAFRVRAHRVGTHGRDLSPQALQREVGAPLAKGRRVEFEGPADEVRVLLGARAHVALLLAAIDRAPFDARHVRKRPFFSPVSLHPRYCRALVNLARVRPGDRVADPFAGTGGILLEAALVGGKVVGADLDPAMARGARESIAHFGLEAEVLEGDVADVLGRVGPVDAIVSDPPYGRASWTDREPVAELYRRALGAASGALRPGGRLAIVFPDRAAADLAPPDLVLEQSHVQRVHRSLDRHYLVFRRT